MKMTHKKKYILDLFDCTKTDPSDVGGWPLTADEVYYLMCDSYIDSPYYEPEYSKRYTLTNSIRRTMDSLVADGLLIRTTISKIDGKYYSNRKTMIAYDIPFELRKGRNTSDEKKYGIYGSLCIGLHRMEEDELKKGSVIEGEFETIVSDDSITLYEAERIYYSKQERHTADLCDLFGI